jgi:hypothetical protein
MIATKPIPAAATPILPTVLRPARPPDPAAPAAATPAVEPGEAPAGALAASSAKHIEEEMGKSIIEKSNIHTVNIRFNLMPLFFIANPPIN